MRLINEAIIHCLGTRRSWFDGKSNGDKQIEVRRWHVVDRGWRAEGYNYFIWLDGELTLGRDTDDDGDTFDEIGAHTKGHNANTLGIALEGGFGSTADGSFSDNFTPEQEITLIKLLTSLEKNFPNLKITGHNQYANKACPGFNVPRWLDRKAAKPQRTSVQQTTTVKASNIAKLATLGAPVIGGVSGIPWPNLLIMGVLAVVVLAALGYIDVERLKKFVRGDR